MKNKVKEMKKICRKCWSAIREMDKEILKLRMVTGKNEV